MISERTFFGKPRIAFLLVLLTTLGGLAVFGIPGMIIGPIIGSLYVAVWQLWGSAVDEARVETENS